MTADSPLWEEECLREACVHDHGDCRELFDLISPFLDRELDEATCEEITRHMQACLPCRRYVESMRATRDVLHQMGEKDPVPAAEAEDLLRDCLSAVRPRLPGATPNP